jgi:hypothetical protein
MNSNVLNTAHMRMSTTGTTTDGNLPLMQVRYIGPELIHTIALDNNGGGSTDALLVSLVTATTTTTFDVDGADETAATLQALVDGINAVDGWEARRANGTADYTTNSNDFIDMAATAIGQDWTSVLYRDSSEMGGVDDGMTMRIASPCFGVYQYRTGGGDSSKSLAMHNGPIEIVRIDGYITGATTAPYLDVILDPSKSASDEKVVARLAMAAHDSAVRQAFLDRKPGEGLFLNGPILFRAGSATGSVPTEVDVTVSWRPVGE